MYWSDYKETHSSPRFTSGMPESIWLESISSDCSFFLTWRCSGTW